MAGAILVAALWVLVGLVHLANSIDRVAKALSTPDALKGDAK